MMTATELIQWLAVLQALTPVYVTVKNGIKDLTGEDVDVETMSVEDLTALKAELEKTAPENWPELKFQSPIK